MTQDDRDDGPLHWHGSWRQPWRLWGRRVGLWVWLWLLLVIMAVEWGLGWPTQALWLAQSLHTGIDSLSVLGSVLAVPEPEPTPCGEVKLRPRQAVGTIFGLGFLGCAACGVLVLVGQRGRSLLLGSGDGVTVPLNLPVLPLVLIGVVLYLALAGVGHYQASRLRSRAFREAAQRAVYDAGRIGLVALSGVAVRGGLAGADVLLAVLLVGSLGFRGWRMLARQLPVLLEPAAIAPEALTQVIHQVAGITQCDRVRAHGLVGRHLVVEMHLVLHPECLDMAQNIAERVKAVIQRRFGPTQVVIHIAGDGVYVDE